MDTHDRTDTLRIGVVEGATENASVVHALLNNLIGGGLDPVEWPGP